MKSRRMNGFSTMTYIRESLFIFSSDWRPEARFPSLPSFSTPKLFPQMPSLVAMAIWRSGGYSSSTQPLLRKTFSTVSAAHIRFLFLKRIIPSDLDFTAFYSNSCSWLKKFRNDWSCSLYRHHVCRCATFLLISVSSSMASFVRIKDFLARSSSLDR